MRPALQDVIKAIKAGQYTPDEMEDMVYAMEHSYEDHFPSIYHMVETSPERYADELVTARKLAD